MNRAAALCFAVLVSICAGSATAAYGPWVSPSTQSVCQLFGEDVGFSVVHQDDPKQLVATTINPFSYAGQYVLFTRGMARYQLGATAWAQYGETTWRNYPSNVIQHRSQCYEELI